ncbi:MAG: hypothetical protein E7214_16060 [Clostridium sp.]|nr:hypothetical protein [Clostridium sp.]
MHSYLKKTLVNRKSIFIYFFINTIIIYNFLIAKDENYINFDIYDTAIGYFGRIGALLVTYLLLVSIKYINRLL